jgi:hypothetical protein
MRAEEFLSRLNGVKKTRGGWLGLCPAHDDRNPSLSVKEAAAGRLLLNCFADCDTESVLDALGLSLADLFGDASEDRHQLPKKASARVRRPNPKKEISASTPNTSDSNRDAEIDQIYRYTDKEGLTIYEKVRLKDKSGGKRFHIRRPDGNGGYLYNLDNVEKAPYNLKGHRNATETESGHITVILAEGEKDCDNLSKLLFSTGRAERGIWVSNLKDWQESFNAYVIGADVILFMDHDAAGRKQAEKTAGIIGDNAKSLKLIDLFDDHPQKGQDVSDWLDHQRRDEGIDDEEMIEKLFGIIESCEGWVSSEKKSLGNPIFKLTFTTLNDLYLEPDEENPFVWEKTLSSGGFSLLTAKPKVGKSTLLRNLAVGISLGEPVLGRLTIPGKVLYLCLEEKREEVRRHFARMGAEGDSILIHSGESPKTTEEAVLAIRDAIDEHQPVIVFIDPLSRVLRNVDFNDYRISSSLELFIDLANETKTHICALHHEGKSDRESSDSIIGSTALYGAVDCHLSMRIRNGVRTIRSTQRYGEDLEETVLQFDRKTGLITGSESAASLVFEELKAELIFSLKEGPKTKDDLFEKVGRRWNGGAISGGLGSLLDEGIITRSGAGKRGCPYLYEISKPKE